MGAQEDLTRSLKAIMARQREGLGGPPAPEELLAYRDDRLSPEERQRLEARIAVYPDAARTLADLAAFPAVEPAPGTPELSEEEVDAGWRAFRGKLEALPRPRRQEEESPKVAPVLELRPGRRRWAGAPRLAAAALAGVALGSAAGFLGGRASQQVPGAAINVKIAELRPDDDGGARSTLSSIEMPEGTEELVLVLRGSPTEDFSDYAVEIEDAAGARLWAREGLRPTAIGTFHLSFRRDALPEGARQLQLFGLQGKTRVPLASYRVRLLSPTSSPEP